MSDVQDPQQSPSRRAVLLGALGGVALVGCGSSGSGQSVASSSSSMDTSSATPSANPAPSPSASVSEPSPSPSEPAINLDVDPATVLARVQVPVLCYHQIRPWTGDDATSSRPYIMPPATFTEGLDAIVAAGYQSISPDQLMAYLTTGASLPDKPILLSYDDSVVDGLTIAAPEMAKRDMTGTYFLMTVVLGKKRYLSSAQVVELEGMGMTIGAHTWDHHRADEYAGADWKIQIEEPAAQLAEIVGHEIPYFAYPFGVWSDAAFPHLREVGQHGAFQLNERKMSATDPLMTIQRMIANPYWSTETLLTNLEAATQPAAV